MDAVYRETVQKVGVPWVKLLHGSTIGSRSPTPAPAGAHEEAQPMVGARVRLQLRLRLPY